MRTFILSSTAWLALVAPCALVQGVPVIDGASLTKQIAKLVEQSKDFGVQKDKDATRKTMADIEAEQLAALEKMTGAITGPGYNVAAMEGGSALGASTVYPAVPSGPVESRLFGDARETVERMIAQVSGEFAGAAASAGLSATQFRCLFQALIKQESRFNVSISSPVGAYGLTQLMPGTAGDMGVDRTIPIQNLRGGAKYITLQLRKFGNIPHALAAYNAGPGAVMKYGGIPPYKETQGYVRNITKFYNEYLATVGGVDALGTLSASDATLAEYSNTADAASHYSASSFTTINQVVERLRSIIEQIDAQPNVKASFELNTYARAEIARILTLRARLMAANQVREAAYEQHLVADRLAEHDFKNMGVQQ